ncbi:MAG TPA: ribosome biogenesis GTP-binding protein YihA/YsxC [Syntrophobacteraceae bacterium]|nr:ribosome biogenesis GTP-binding protein YihA/YsxC [Syntrophobacteraceae bacterium]
MIDDPTRSTQDSAPETREPRPRKPHTSLLVIKTAEFETSAVRPGQYPVSNLPEVAFAGRSNVGKSSLINCLTQRKKLVRTSRTPGLTRMINFFRINEAFYFVDLPGYGFARVPEKVRAQWKPMVESYLLGRKTLRGIVQILDLRHPPTQDDLQLWTWLQDRRIPSIPVLTKADKVPRGKWLSQAKATAVDLGVDSDRIVLFSSVTGLGREHLMERIRALVDPPAPDA